jgi:adenosylmethionine-8-amino-7-oxononanoate aminotransferase
MPVVSMFYGIVVLMYYFDNKKHHQPHVHVESGDDEAVISIPDGAILEGISSSWCKLGSRFTKKN